VHVAGSERVEVGLGSRVLPHVHVHSGRNDDRRCGGEIERGEKVVGDAVREFGKDAGGGRRNNKGVSCLRGFNMFDGGVEVVVGRLRRCPQAGETLCAVIEAKVSG